MITGVLSVTLLLSNYPLHVLVSRSCPTSPSMSSKRARGHIVQVATVQQVTYEPEEQELQAEQVLAKVLLLDTGNMMKVYEGIRKRLLAEGELRGARSVDGAARKRKARCLKQGCRGCESRSLAPLQCSNITAPPCFQLDHPAAL